MIGLDSRSNYEICHGEFDPLVALLRLCDMPTSQYLDGGKLT